MIATLEQLQALLRANAAPRPEYRIPLRWDFFGFSAQDGGGEITVDPCAFYDAALSHLRSLPEAPFTPAARVLYTMLPRFHTAYAHTSGLEGGTLLKTVALLPMLRDMGVNTLCLLPVFVTSARYCKGSLGSPYAIRDFFHLDPALHDPLLGAYCEESLELAFAALVEGAHRLGMQVILDIVLRTAARDHVWVGTHPEWFYWMRTDAQDIPPPHVPSLPTSPVNAANAHLLYTAPGSPAYLSAFSHHPRAIDAARFDTLGTPALESIEEAFSLTTAPAFCDVINDPQPLWTDVTYLRLDMGQNEIARAHLDAQHPPVLLQDTIKLNLFEPGQPNEALYGVLASVLPSWQTRFGIDGARIDMGHALPRELLTRIVSCVRKENPHFFLWNEAFIPADAAGARNDGFNAVTGQLWNDIWALQSPYFHKRVLDPLLERPLPSLAALEMPDTPRAAQRCRDARELAGLWQFAVLLPNVMPLINDGQELLERQPMNLGLNNTERGRFVLDADDPAYGRLAFFDMTSLHWNGEDFSGALKDALALRSRFSDLLCDKAHFRMTARAHRHRRLSAFAYTDGKRALLVMYLRRGKRARFSPASFFDRRLLASCTEILQWLPAKRPLDALPRACTLERGELWVISADLGVRNL